MDDTFVHSNDNISEVMVYSNREGISWMERCSIWYIGHV